LAIAITILVLLVAGGFIGTAIDFGGVFLGIPLVLIFIGALIGRETMERQRSVLQKKRFCREARTRKVDLDATDKRTVV